MSNRPSGPEDSDASTAARLRARDGRALQALYAGHGSVVHGLALRILRTGAEAEEVTQDVFLHAWQHIERFDARRGTLAAWLVTLARSRAIDRLRARASQARRVEGLARTAAEETPPPGGGPLHDMILRERADRVQRVLHTLSPEQRQAIEIAYFEGLSHSEIATRLGTPLGTIKTRIRHGMLRMRDGLESDARTEAAPQSNTTRNS